MLSDRFFEQTVVGNVSRLFPTDIFLIVFLFLSRPFKLFFLSVVHPRTVSPVFPCSEESVESFKNVHQEGFCARVCDQIIHATVLLVILH